MAPRAHAITFLHKMITDDPTHASKLVKLMIAKLDKIRTEQDLERSQKHLIEHRIMQVVLILQPILETVSKFILFSYVPSLSFICLLDFLSHCFLEDC